MHSRISFIKGAILLGWIVILSRLFYWQILSNTTLSVEAQSQRTSTQLIPADRGSILASDGYSIVTNEPEFLLYAYKPQLEITPNQISLQLANLLTDPNPKDATEAAKPLEQRINQTHQDILAKLSDDQKQWIPLWRHLKKDQKQAIDKLKIIGLGFDQETVRYYPEASMSAHLLGFVSKDEQGNPQGYFGLEGYYDRELRGKAGKINQETDATGKPILIGLFNKNPGRQGRDLKLHLDRTLQNLIEKQLQKGIEVYGAASGEVIIMQPHTGAILAMASWPSYSPDNFVDYQTSLYKNPLIANTYEPGSTFKVITMAAAIEEGVIEPNTHCDSTCDGPVTIGKFTIRTWNNEYNPGQTMTEVLARSDNTGMIFTAFKLGKYQFIDYLEKFGFGQATGIDLQEETVPTLRKKWGDIDVATTSFGQGIAVTGIQMVQAVSAIANGGNLMEPQVVSQVIDQKTNDIKPKVIRQVISKQTADKVTQMMIESAHHGEAQWTALKNYQIAGKTGTAQIPIAGHYDAEKTIASFVGFAPANDPEFVMLVKLTEPTSSPWAAETAAPLWYQIANEALIYLKVPPKQ